ncbi:MAG: FAD-binding oxidoreductase [Polyangiaceae bacterium]
MASETRRFWGWGHEEHVVPSETLAFAEASLGALLGAPLERRAPPRVEDVPLPAPRFALPDSLAHLATTAPFDRLNHALGKSYRDIARAVARRVPHPPDVVAFPTTEAEIVALLDHAAHHRVAVVPYGGGSSVAGGVEPRCDGFDRTMSLDLTRMESLLAVDPASRAARIQAGALGPRVEQQLRPHGLTLRHFPQSFEFSSLGGWIATRAGGHYATLATHIDDLVESIRVVTPSGIIETRRLPGSGAGPQPERLFMGSEGALGVITEAWMRVVPRPTYRASATVKFDSFEKGLDALREISQSGLHPTNARLLDPAEAMVSGSGSGDAALLLLAFESADHALEPWIQRAVELARASGGRCNPDRVKASHDFGGARDETADTYKKLFLEAPYLRDEIILRGVFVETYETATVWSNVGALDAAVREAVARVVKGPHVLATRITHAYPDGCAPYYTLLCAAHPTDPEAQWIDVKAAITDAIVAAGGTSTHHHAVGRDVLSFYEKERPPLFGAALSAVKRTLDPVGIMNPGVLVAR